MAKDQRRVPDADEQFEEMKEELVSRRIAQAGGCPKPSRKGRDSDED